MENRVGADGLPVVFRAQGVVFCRFRVVLGKKRVVTGKYRVVYVIERER